jgi:transcription termination/antitermination protein NusG
MESNQIFISRKISPIINCRNWYVAYTAPRAEKRIAQRLDKEKIEYFLPIRKEFRKWSDRIKQIDVPAFPSYIFVHVNQNEYYSAINLTGMVKYVHFGGVPAIINEHTIEHIRRAMEISTNTELCDNLPSPGDKYKITSGPLDGIEGTVVRLKGKTHFFLELKEWGKYLMLPYTATSN